MNTISNTDLKNLTIDIMDGIATITIRRGSKLNALNYDTIED
ncbi:MAG TPA: enoyl-CoA hydratase, partial [Microscillaceae bacterium]|nr:enoyl-CoA hydratase [Microscillaceae bacterium]